MKPILLLFWQICRLKQSPAHLPEQASFALAVIVANLICSIAVTSLADGLLETDSGRPIPLLATATSIVVSQATLAALTWLALQLRNLSGRFFATIAALFGCDLIITACFGALLPLLSLMPAVTALAFLLFLVWSISVMGYIFHRALDVQLAIGIFMAVGVSIVGVAMSDIATASA